MDGKYILYFDSGTTNTRAYLLKGSADIVSVRKKNVGSRDSAIAGSNHVLIRCMWELYQETLEETGITEDDIKTIYASGMITCPYGLHEIPHVEVPVTVQNFSEDIFPFFEDSRFHRTINLVPGLKSLKEDFSFTGNMRGEEIEIIGTLDDLKERGVDNVALIFPGSHTHITYLKNEVIEDIISTFSGELFHALKKETIFAPILDREEPEIDAEMVKLAYHNITRFGFNRAIYIGHAMRMLDRYDSEKRYSYCEGVINGGVRQVLEYYCEKIWPQCNTAAIVSDEFMYRLFKILFEDSEHIKRLLWLPNDSSSNYAVKGLKKIISINGGK